jgi:3-deoxy-7-phosphoheptulonate synthase
MIITFVKEKNSRKIIDILNEYNFSFYVNKDSNDVVSVVTFDKIPKVAEPFIEGSLSENDCGYLLVSRLFKQSDSVIDVGHVSFGGGMFPIIAGPCSVEDKYSFIDIAFQMKEIGVNILRGGIFKPRSSPHRFQGLGLKGLEILLEARQQTGLPICTEVMHESQIKEMKGSVDLFQVGSRNSQNIGLLRALGESRTPVLLKRGFGCTIEEWLGSAEFIYAAGNTNIILCERGIRTFEDIARFTLDVNAVPIVKEISHLPIIIDPSHAAGNRNWVGALSKCSLGLGADGLEIEVHNDPDKSITDSKQAMSINEFKSLFGELKQISKVTGKEIPSEHDNSDGRIPSVLL